MHLLLKEYVGKDTKMTCFFVSLRSSRMIIYSWKASRVKVNKNNLSCETSFLHSDFQLQRQKSTEMSRAFLGDYIISTLRRETFLCRTA